MIDRALQLETVPEAQKPPPGPGRGHKSDESKTTYRDDKEFSGPTAARLRAITRAPDVVKDAYREGSAGPWFSGSKYFVAGHARTCVVCNGPIKPGQGAVANFETRQVAHFGCGRVERRRCGR